MYHKLKYKVVRALYANYNITTNTKLVLVLIYILTYISYIKTLLYYIINLLY